MYEEACWWPMPGWCTSCTPSLSVNRSESRTRSTALRGGERFGRDEGVSREGFGLAGNGVGRDDDDGRRRRRGEGDAPRGERRSEARSRSGRRAGAPPRTAGRSARQRAPAGRSLGIHAPHGRARARRGLRGTPAGAATEANMTSLLSTGRPPEKPRARVCDQPGGREKGSRATATRAGSHTTPPSTAPSRVPIRMAPRRERRGIGGRESHPKIQNKYLRGIRFSRMSD